MPYHIDRPTIGTLVYWETLRSGLIPCRIVAITRGAPTYYSPDGPEHISIETTAARAPYRRGERIDGLHWNHVIPRAALARRKYGTTIRAYRYND